MPQATLPFGSRPLALAAIWLALQIGPVPPGQAQSASDSELWVQTSNGTPLRLYASSHALIVGLSSYGPGWSSLPGVRRDVVAVQQVLERHGFSVEVAMDLTATELQHTFRRFVDQHGQHPENRLLFYYAGHGYTMRQAYGAELGYIVPTNAPNPHFDSTGFRSRAMDMNQIASLARRIQSKHALFVFDACFAGKIFASARGALEPIRYKTSQPVRQFITSGSADEEVPDESLFRSLFVTGLEGAADISGDGYVTGLELGMYLQDQVITYSGESQHPQYGKLIDPILSQGDFVFVLPEARLQPLRPTDRVSIDSLAYRLRRQQEHARATWIHSMDSAFAQAGRHDTDARLQPAFKIESWHRFLTDYGTDVRDTTRDDSLRAKARTRMTYWREHLKMQPALFRNLTGMSFVYVPPGHFTMGSNTGSADERPAHDVTISRGFFMGQHEVTRAQFRAFAEATGYRTTAERTGGCHVFDEKRSRQAGRSAFRKEPTASWRTAHGGPQHPVVCISWMDAQAFIAWLNSLEEGTPYRLPTEAEWEYAACARGSVRGVSNARPADLQPAALHRVANYADRNFRAFGLPWADAIHSDGFAYTAPVGNLEPNAWGLYDMLGNVWEWVADWYDADAYSRASIQDPQGPLTGTNRGLRGGSWAQLPAHVRPSNRHRDGPGSASVTIGFRVVRTER